MNLIAPLFANIVNFKIPTDAVLKYFTVLYLYTTGSKRPKIKVGSARRLAYSAEHAAHLRIKEQITAADSADPYILLGVIDVSDECETSNDNESLSNLRNFEAFVHRRLKTQGMWVYSESKRSEWFHDPIKNDINEVINATYKAANEKVHGVARPNNFSMRVEQQECHNQFVNIFKTTKSKRVLMNAKPRFGKTFTTYNIIATLGCKRVLVLTGKPAVDAEWRKDMEQHVKFDGWTYLSARDDFDSNNPIEMVGNDTQILFASLQDLTDFNKKKWSIAKNYTYDLLVLDEYHWGTKTENSAKIFDQLKFDKCIAASGTPIKALMSGEFLEEEIYNFGYIEEQELKKQEELSNWKTEYYRWLPKMNFFTYDVCEQARKLVEAYEKDEGFSLTKMLMTDEKGNFIDEGAVDFFIDQLFGRLQLNKKHMPWYHLQKIDHMLFYMPPRVTSVAAFCKLLERKIGNIYKIINAAGSGEEVTDDIDDVKQIIASNPKTITVSCGRFNTGVTVKEWDAVCMLEDGRSAENYIQTIFRCQSSDEKRKKENCYVIDFNPQRCLEMIYNYCEIVAKTGSSTQGTIKKFLDFAPILEHTDNKIVQVDVNNVLNVVSELGSYTERFGSSWMMNWANIDQVAQFFNNVKAKKNIKIKHEVANNDLDPTKNSISSGGNTTPGTINIVKANEKLLREKIITVMRYLPTYLVCEDNDIENVNDIIKTNNVTLFKDVMGINVADFSQMVNLGIINQERMNRCIMSFQQLKTLQ